jgi:hypothetical protein
MRDDFASTVDFDSTFIYKMKAENTQLNVLEVSFARGMVGKNSFGKRGSSGISNVSNTAVGESFFEKHEYHAITPYEKNILHLKRPKREHVGNVHGGNGNGNGNRKGNGKGPTLKSLTRSTAALADRFDKFNLPDDDDEDDDDNESSEEEEGNSNR